MFPEQGILLKIRQPRLTISSLGVMNQWTRVFLVPHSASSRPSLCILANWGPNPKSCGITVITHHHHVQLCSCQALWQSLPPAGGCQVKQQWISCWLPIQNWGRWQKDEFTGFYSACVLRLPLCPEMSEKCFSICTFHEIRFTLLKGVLIQCAHSHKANGKAN